MRELGARHRAAALVVLAAVVRTLDLVRRCGLSGLRRNGPVMMAAGHLRNRRGNRFAHAVGMRHGHRGRGRQRGEQSREQSEQQRSGDHSMHWPQRRKERRLSQAPSELPISPISEGDAESACRKHRAVLGAGQSPRRGRQKNDIGNRAGRAKSQGWNSLPGTVRVKCFRNRERGRPRHTIDRRVEGRSSGVVAS